MRAALENALRATNSATGAASTTNFTTSETISTTGAATVASNATNAAGSTLDIVNTLQAQQQAVSGVSIDEETINLIKEQEAYAGAARIISTVDTMMTALLAIT